MDHILKYVLMLLPTALRYFEKAPYGYARFPPAYYLPCRAMQLAEFAFFEQVSSALHFKRLADIHLVVAFFCFFVDSEAMFVA